MRLLACELLAESKEENVIAALRAVVVNDTLEVAQVAIRTLGRLGEPGAGALRDVIRTVDLPDPGRRVAAIRAIAGLPSSVPILIGISGARLALEGSISPCGMKWDCHLRAKHFLINTTGGSGATSPPLTVVTNRTVGLRE